MVRSRRDGRGRPHLPGLAGVRSGAGADLRARQRGRGADHRLPLRHGPRHADLDHGRHGPRGRARRSCSARGEALQALRRRRGGGPRQDRHADQGTAGADRPDRRPGLRRSRGTGARRRGRDAVRASRSARPSSRRPGTGASNCASAREFRGRARLRRSRRRSRAAGSRSAPTATWSGSASDRGVRVGGAAARRRGQEPALCRHRRPARRDHRGGRPDQADHAGGDRGAAPPGPQGGDDHRRQPPHGGGHRPPARHRRGDRRGPARRQGRRGEANCRPADAASPSSATASTMPRRWPRPMSASPSAPAPTWRSRAPTWC